MDLSSFCHLDYFYFPRFAICNTLLPLPVFTSPCSLQSVCILGLVVLRAGISSPPQHSMVKAQTCDPSLVTGAFSGLPISSKVTWGWKEWEGSMHPNSNASAQWSSAWVLSRFHACVSSLGGQDGVESRENLSPQSWEVRGTTTIAWSPVLFWGSPMN